MAERPVGREPDPRRVRGAERTVLDGPMRYYRVRWETGFRFTMVGISETPFQDCTVEDPRSEVYPPFLTRDLLNPPAGAAP